MAFFSTPFEKFSRYLKRTDCLCMIFVRIIQLQYTGIQLQYTYRYWNQDFCIPLFPHFNGISYRLSSWISWLGDSKPPECGILVVLQDPCPGRYVKNAGMNFWSESRHNHMMSLLKSDTSARYVFSSRRSLWLAAIWFHERTPTSRRSNKQLSHHSLDDGICESICKVCWSHQRGIRSLPDNQSGLKAVRPGCDRPVLRTCR